LFQEIAMSGVMARLFRDFRDTVHERHRLDEVREGERSLEGPVDRGPVSEREAALPDGRC
jgi:hypothetical protein